MNLNRKKKHFSKKVIGRAVADVESGMSRAQACKKYGMRPATICDWIMKYGSKLALSNSKLKIDPHKKRMIISGIQEGLMTLSETSLSYGIKLVTLRQWISKSKKESNAELGSNEPPMPILKDPKSEDLQRALHNANLKILALETMIDVAEEHLKINIRKKPGAKQ
ncbi:MAG: transposase [Chryseolinea sp.]